MLTFKTLISRPTSFIPQAPLLNLRCSAAQRQQPLSHTIPHTQPFTLNNTKIPIFSNVPESYDYYCSMRIYQNHSWYDLANLILMTYCLSSDYFVTNSLRIYNGSHKIFGSRITEYMVANTMGRIYTSGNSSESMEQFIKGWRHPNVNILMSYSNEAPPELVNTELLDENARNYAESLSLCFKANQNNNGMAFKVSSLCHLQTLKNSNQAQVNLRSLFSSGFGDLSQSVTAREVVDWLKQKDVQFTFKEFQDFMSLFLNKRVTEDSLDQVTITKFEWLNDIHMFYVQDPQKNANSILRQVAKLDKEDLDELERFNRRLKLIFDRGVKEKQKVLVDAEQSYMQSTIDSFAVQYSNIHNKESAVILNTFQNYLKSTKDRIHYELERCKALGIPFGIKMVRGAYMVEERRLAKEQGHEDPIMPTIEDTHNNYNSNLEYLMSNWVQNSQVLIASHNEHSVKWGKYLVKKYDINLSKGFISFAQLFGLGDHLTFSLAKEGFTVGKMCHFGPLPYMIPFLIRRAQESRQVLASSALKRRLAYNEIGRRMKFYSH